MNQAKDWIPFFAQLIWPLFLVILFITFKSQVSSIFVRVNNAIGEGRSVQVGDWLKIGEKTSIGELSSKVPLDPDEEIDLSMESVGGYHEYVEKSSYIVLEKLKRLLQDSPTYHIDVLLINSSRIYSTKLLSNYITTLGIRFVIFQENGKFRGWMDAGLFNSQLPTRDDQWNYNRLHSELVGIRQDIVYPNKSAINVLIAMEKANSENIAVVKDGKFRFIANRGNILSKLLTASIIDKKLK